MVTEANRAETLSLVYARGPPRYVAKRAHDPLNLVLILTQHCLIRATVFRDRVRSYWSVPANLSIRYTA